jgi:predicted secreted Zn-dependent protease
MLLFLFISFLFAKPLVQERYEFYDIYPTNKHLLEDSMDDFSPIVNFGSIRHGTVHWKIRYRYKRQLKLGVCRIIEVKTLVDVLYSIPKISKDFKISRGMKSAFRRYYDILLVSLKKHRSYAVEASNEIERELLKLKTTRKYCDSLNVEAKTIGSNIIQKYKQKNKNYEIRTYEGFLEGISSEKL